MARIENHELRISNLEQTNPKQKGDIKEQLLMYLAKALVIAVTVIGGLTGASALIKEIVK